MAEDRRGLKIKEDGLGEVQIAEEVITIIAGLAATEVEVSAPWAATLQRVGKPSWYEKSFQRCTHRSG